MADSTTGTRISLCMLVHDEEELLPGCLESVSGLVDEIVVGVDTRTSDRTREIAAIHGAYVSPSRWQDDFSIARNEVLERATGTWVLHLDADERLTAHGRVLIRHAVVDAAEAGYDGLSVKVQHTSQNGGVTYGTDYKTRVFKSYLRYKNVAHEVVECENLVQIAMTEPFIRHVGYDPVLFKKRDKLQRNKFLIAKWVRQEPDNPLANYYMARLLALVSERQQPIGEPYALKALALGRETLMPHQLEFLRSEYTGLG